MTYYKVKPQFDNYRRHDGSIWVANELYTATELARFKASPHMFDRVEVSKRKTYWFFGARFASQAEN